MNVKKIEYAFFDAKIGELLSVAAIRMASQLKKFACKRLYRRIFEAIRKTIVHCANNVSSVSWLVMTMTTTMTTTTMMMMKRSINFKDFRRNANPILVSLSTKTQLFTFPSTKIYNSPHDPMKEIDDFRLKQNEIVNPPSL